jgi:hypothetical protein
MEHTAYEKQRVTERKRKGGELQPMAGFVLGYERHNV